MTDTEEDDDDFELIEASDEVKSISSRKSSKSTKSWVSCHTNKSSISQQTNKSDKSWVFAELRRELSDSYQPDGKDDTYSLASSTFTSSWYNKDIWYSKEDDEFNGWRNEKEERALEFGKKVHDGLHGRTGRRKCPCRYCNKESSFEGAIRISTNPKEFLVSDFELQHEDMSRGTSLNKHKKWETLKQALQSVATSSGEIKNKRDKNNKATVTFFDVPIAGMIVEKKSEEKVDEMNFNSSSKAWSFFNRYKQFTVFSMISDYKLETYVQGVEPYEMVKKVFSPSGIEEEVKKEMKIERVKDYKVFAYYGKLKPVLQYYPRCDMIPENNISPSVKGLYNQKHALRNLPSSQLDATTRWMNLHELQNCFFPDISSFAAMEYNAYEDWYLEFDLKRERRIKGLMIAGKAPKLSCFPKQAWVNSHPLRDRIKKVYQGPVFPILNTQQQHQFVKRFELYVRREKSSWVSLGIFSGNEEMWMERFVRLSKGHLCRYVRIRPLAKSKNGYEGDRPAMRVVLFEEEGGEEGKEEGRKNVGMELEEGHLRYIVKEVNGVGKQSKVQGPGSGAYDPYRDRWGEESKFLKRKGLDEVILESLNDYDDEKIAQEGEI